MADRPTFKLRRKNRSDESDGQKHVVRKLRAYLPARIWWTVSLSGIRLPPHIAAEAKRMGMERGAPDFSFVFPDGVTRYIDLKTEQGSLTLEQRQLRRRVGEDDFAVCHVYATAPHRTWAEFKAVLDRWMEPYEGLTWLTDAESVAREMRRRGEAA